MGQEGMKKQFSEQVAPKRQAEDEPMLEMGTLKEDLVADLASASQTSLVRN